MSSSHGKLVAASRKSTEAAATTTEKFAAVDEQREEMGVEGATFVGRLGARTISGVLCMHEWAVGPG